jgi:hypothetical protein
VIQPRNSQQHDEIAAFAVAYQDNIQYDHSNFT